VLSRRTFFHGRHLRGSEIKDIAWYTPAGQEMTDEEWAAESVRYLGVLLAGDAINELDEQGRVIRGETLLLLLNAHHEPIPFTLPARKPNTRWVLLMDTATPDFDRRAQRDKDESCYLLQDRSMVLFRLAILDEHGTGRSVDIDRRHS
jgi:isoamylase